MQNILHGGFDMNNFIEAVNIALEEARQREKQRKQKLKESLIRNDEDWERIDSFLKRKVLEAIKNSDGSSWIRIVNYRPSLLVSVDEEILTINHLDIKRFCKQYGFKLRYSVKEDQKQRTKFFFSKNNTVAYLIRVKHIL